MDARQKFWVVIPAAGSGSRFASGSAQTLPKQYLQLAGRTVLEWALAPFLARRDLQRIVVVLSPADSYWQTLAVAQHPRILAVAGGPERVDSVRNGLRALSSQDPAPASRDGAPGAARERTARNFSPQQCAHENDWVLVHDAARPCLTDSDLERLIDSLRDDPVGGLLALPLADTLKRADAQDRVRQTVPREQLWRALTPQMFRHGVLMRALDAAAHAAHEAASPERAGRPVGSAASAAPTDESSAVELLGLRPRLVRGRADNLKITLPQDLALASCILSAAAAQQAPCAAGREPPSTTATGPENKGKR
jgi:2-C-methyl-D-erythritol 4-phosphate cytidylyltransferase